MDKEEQEDARAKAGAPQGQEVGGGFVPISELPEG